MGQGPVRSQSDQQQPQFLYPPTQGLDKVFAVSPSSSNTLTVILIWSLVFPEGDLLAVRELDSSPGKDREFPLE